MKTIVVITAEPHLAKALAEFVATVLSEMHPPPAQVLPACSVDDVLDILANTRIDILMVDHHLGGMAGLELVRWLGTGLINTTKILLTHDSRLLAEPWRFAGPDINAVLPKPLGRTSLRVTLQRWLEPADRIPAPARDHATNARPK
jgi:CheY-like chemotaxis protein